MPDLSNLKLELVVSSGIPEAYAATLNLIAKIRETMDADIRRRYDLVNIWLVENFWAPFGYQPPAAAQKPDNKARGRPALRSAGAG